MLVGLRKLGYGVSVYGGISPTLLATISLSAGIKGETNDELVDSLASNGVISDQHLLQSMRDIDRKLFIPNLQSTLNPYQNKPYPISSQQNMTDIFTQAVILQRVCQHLKNMNTRQTTEIQVLDIGTGHGYLAWIMASFLTKAFQGSTFRISAIDNSQSAISFCQALRSKVSGSLSGTVDLLNVGLERFAAMATDQFDIITGGFYMPPDFQSKLLPMLKQGTGMGIWAADGPNGQALFTHTRTAKQSERQEIMSTLFSYPNSDTANQVHSNPASNEQINKESSQSQLTQKLTKRAQKQQQLRQQLKHGIERQQASRTTKLSLQEIRKIPQLSNILKQLQKYR